MRIPLKKERALELLLPKKSFQAETIILKILQNQLLNFYTLSLHLEKLLSFTC